MKIPVEKIASGTAVGLIVLSFIVAASNIFTRQVKEADPNTTTLRLAHHYLDPKVSEAFAAVIEDYQKLKAEEGQQVRVVQIPVPERVYMQWVRTQITGGTAPDIIHLEGAGGWGIDSVFKAQNLVVFDSLIDLPNPYNEGTELEGKPWRETFMDGLEVGGFDFPLAQHFGVPLNSGTTRLVANKTMLDKILAEADPQSLQEVRQHGHPVTYDGLVELCQAAEAYGRKRGEILYPIAADKNSVDNNNTIFGRLFTSQTQKLNIEWAQFKDYRTSERFIQLQALAGEITIRHPYMVNGFAIMREIGAFVQPGFLQMSGEDALFYFAQQRALIITVPSQEFSLLEGTIGDRFEVTAFPVPLPKPDHPRYGAGVLGTPISERSASPTATFGIVNYHPPAQRELAIDFLHYLTSPSVNAKFAALSKSLPSNVASDIPEQLQAFAAIREGYPGGPGPGVSGGAVARDWLSYLRANYHILFSPEGSVDQFMDRLEEAYWEIAFNDVIRSNTQEVKAAMQQDVVIAAYLWMISHDKGNVKRAQRQIDFLIDAGDYREVRLHYFNRILDRLEAERASP